MIRCEVVTPWRRVNGVNEMAVALDYPASWSDATGQHDEYILNGVEAFVAYGEVSEAQMAALETDAHYVVLWSAADETEPPDALTPEQVTALQTGLQTAYHSDVAKLVTAEATAPLAVSAALREVNLRPPWQAGLSVVAGAVYYYAGNLYEVIQAHKTQSDWTPNIVPALFKRYYEPDDDPWPWVQPTGAHDAYPKGARVTHRGYTWQSTIAANVWEPGSAGAEALWTNLTPPPPPPPLAPWAYPVAYKGDNTQGAGNGDLVSYNGRKYRCWQSHTSQAGWTPPAVPALWIDLGPI